MVNLLYVDDDSSKEGIRHIKSMCQFIEEEFSNIKTDYALTNREALSKLQTYEYNVVLYDVGMDRTEGYPIAHAIKDLKPAAMLIGMSLNTEFRMGNLPDCFDEKIWMVNLAINYRAVLPKLLIKKGIVLEKRKEDSALKK